MQNIIPADQEILWSYIMEKSGKADLKSCLPAQYKSKKTNHLNLSRITD